MSNPERDTKFQGFAKLLMDELGDQGFVFDGADDINRDEQLEQIKLLIARRAYDFACHNFNYTTESMTRMFVDEAIEAIPDMTRWPKDSRNE